MAQGGGGDIPVITRTEDLAAFCERARRAPFVTLDTEFLRERTYFAQLCLVQMALPEEMADEGPDAVVIDPIAGDLDLAPLWALLADENVIKVLHAARQDVEIFHNRGGVIPEPLFDTQVAAMVCGFGEQVGYETLVRRIAGARIDKTSRFTDWSRRPLSEEQLRYALADVTHLRQIYRHLSSCLKESGREEWVREEMAVLTDPATYEAVPGEMWRKIRTRTTTPTFLAVVRELARFREEYARAKNIPRGRVFKDDALLELASVRPQSEADLARTRLLQREARRGEIAKGILAAIRRGIETPPEARPRLEKTQEQEQKNPALADLLRVLLKARAEEAGVAQRLIATAADLDALAAGRRDVPALRGWRHEAFGKAALELIEGRIALAVDGRRVRAVPLEDGKKD